MADEYRIANRPVRELFLLVDAVRNLPEQCAMFDGKKWCAIPIIAITSSGTWTRLMEMAEMRRIAGFRNSLDGVHFVVEDNAIGAAEDIKQAVEDYRFQVLSELDNRGFMVQYEHGRYVVGYALERRKGLDSKYYFGPGDYRPGEFFTVHKDNLGVALEVEQFESLINRSDVSELELQRFLEEHPHFLSNMHTPLPHVRLTKAGGGVLIPDFILRPIVAQKRDSTWEILDLKRPQERILSGRGQRARLSSKVIAAIRQLRDYKEHFNDPANAGAIATRLGHRLRHPRLGVLIGRSANLDLEALEREQEHQIGIRIVTYDQILERQQAQIV